MRTAVLVTNYIVVGLLAMALVGTTSEDNPAGTMLGIILLSPAIILSLIYAHKTKENK